MPSRAPVPINISTWCSVHTCACVFLLQLRIRQCLSLKRVLRKEQQLLSKRKSPNCSTVLVINFSISWIYLESSCFYFPLMPRKMTKFVLKDLFEENVFWKGHVLVIKERVVGFVFLVEVLHSSRWGLTLCP